MKIIPCFLDDANPLVINGIPLGRRILSSGKKHLWEERKGSAIDVMVIHYISASAIMPRNPYYRKAILKIFCDCGVSSHFLINRKGGIYRLVPEDKKAWHCGGSIMPEPDNRKGVNEFSIGIELAATASSGFTLFQYRAIARLCADLEKKYKKKFIYTGHDLVAGTRAVKLGLRRDPKADPGRLFRWDLFFKRLAKARKQFP